MLGQCHGAVWRADDFSRCFVHDYLQTLIPAVAAGLSVVWLLYQLLRASTRSKQRRGGYARLKQQITNGSAGVPGSSEDDTDADDSEDGEVDELRRNEAVALRQTESHKSAVEISRPPGELYIALAEEIAILGEVAVHAIAYVLQAWGPQGGVAAIASVAVWAYIALLASLRLFSSTTSRLKFTKLWYHTASLYGVIWLCTVLLFRSEILHPQSRPALALMSTNFALNTVLLTIALSSRSGNRPVKIEHEDGLEPSRELLASVFSLATFAWVDPLVWRGFRRTLEMPDVWNLVPTDRAAAVLADYRQVKKTNKLAFHLLGYFKGELFIQSAWGAATGFLIFGPTLLLKALLEYVEDPTSAPVSAAWFYVMLLFVSGAVTALANGQALWVGRKICIRLRAIIICEVYAKALRRRAAATTDKVLGASKKPAGKQSWWRKALCLGRKGDDDDKGADSAAEPPPADDSQVTSGAIINLMAVDSFKVAELSAYLHFLWGETPVLFIMAIVLLIKVLGISSIVGLGIMVLILPLNMFIANRFSAAQKKILAATDARIHTTNEVLTNIRIIKYFAWEHRFMANVDEKREVELGHLWSRYILWGFAATVWSGTPFLISYLTFFMYTVVEKKDLIPSIAFTALSLFSLLRIPLDQLADMIAHVQESKVSVDRVEEYLNEPETTKYEQLKTTEHDENGDPRIGFRRATFSWGGSGDSDDFKMIDLDLFFMVGKLNVITGPTGSGKTSLLMALLGEMMLLEGGVYLPGGRSREELKPDPRTHLVEGVAYCAQQAWLVNGTVRENIVFAGEWDPKRYKQVIDACSLQRDLEILDAGDQTLVGEKGVTLSGGQKQRISLARALYSHARHVLLDDVLSAVDSHTAKWIFEKAILGPLMNERTCILVTHNAVLCLPHADLAVVLDNGRVSVQGTAAQVISSGKLAEDMSKFESRPVSRAASTRPSRVPSDEAVNGNVQDSGPVPTGPSVRTEPTLDAVQDGQINPAPNGHILSKAKSFDVEATANITTDPTIHDEQKVTGAIKWSLIAMYFHHMGGPFYWFLATLAFVLQQVSNVATNAWIREWANAYTHREAISLYSNSTLYSHPAHSNSPVTHLQGGITSSYTCLRSGSCLWAFPSWTQPVTDLSITVHGTEVNVGYYLGVYAILGVIYMMVTGFRELVLFAGSIFAARRIHRQLIESVSRAKFRFFDTTPLGQIMNRFSKDIEAVDQEIAPVFVGVVHCLASVLAIVILISVITPGFLIAAFFISILYIMIGAFYLSSSRDLKRLDSVQRSPIYQQFGETLTGMTTIRAYGDERRFIRQNVQRVNTFARPFIFLWAANRWLSFRVDVVGALVSFFAGVFIILSVGRIDAGAAGLSMTYAVTFTDNVLWFVRLYAMNEQNMNAVERIKEYLDVDQEAAPIVPDRRPAPDWPAKGAVEFDGYSTRYRSDFDFVLKNISFKIAAGEKVGVVGRTGAGKSSLALALFRALEAEKGRILVDEVDIGQIGLQDLRENIVMVPQDPTLFTGTVRSNLDPFGLFTDDEIFAALRRVQLISTLASAPPSRPKTPVAGASAAPPRTPVDTTHLSVPSTPVINAPESPISAATSPVEGTLASSALENKNVFRNLASPVAESGSNLSQGQRQLLCLARAMLKNPKVLLMDEATASIDYATDAKIQETIREIKNTTITIAHRLQTIIDYDKVLVLDHGEVVEFGDPYELMRKDEAAGAMFRDMCQMTGDWDVLLRDAKAAHAARQLVDVGDD